METTIAQIMRMMKRTRFIFFFLFYFISYRSKKKNNMNDLQDTIRYYESLLNGGAKMLELRRFYNYLVGGQKRALRIVSELVRGGLTNAEKRQIQDAIYENDREKLRQICNRFYHNIIFRL